MVAILIVSIYAFVFIVSVSCALIIKSYHENKALGLQSILGKVIVIFIQVFVLTSLTIAGPFGLTEIVINIDTRTAMVISVTKYLVGVAFYLSVTFVTLTKFLSIYHSPLVHDLSEGVYLRFVKSLHLGVPILLASLEFSFWTDVRITETYQMLSKDDTLQGAHNGYGLKAMILLAFTSAVALQIRIEVDYLRDKNESHLSTSERIKNWFRATESDEKLDYSLNVSRLIVCITSALVIVVALQTFKVLSFRIYMLILYLVMGNVCPIIFISSHPGLKAYAWKILKTHITHLRTL